MINIPNWAQPYVMIEDHETVLVGYRSLAEREEMKTIFIEARRTFKRECQQLTNLSKIPTAQIEEYAATYVICNVGLAIIARGEAKSQNSEPTSKGSANDGTGRQHWIPESYMKPFSKEITDNSGTVAKVKKVFKRENVISDSKGNKEKIVSKLIHLKEEDFRERRAVKGMFYSPEFELLLSRLETDYSKIELSPRPKNLWDFIVLATFFLIFSIRNKEYRTLAGPDDSHLNDLSSYLIFDIPQRISNLEVRLLHRTVVIPLDDQDHLERFNQGRIKANKPMRFPFTQNPFYFENEPNGEFSLWSICSPDYVIWLRNKETQYNSTKHLHSLYERLQLIIENNDVRDTYFHPDDLIWDISPLNPSKDFFLFPYTQIN